MRDKHGQYNQEKHLPNNTGQSAGSGIYTWLIEETQKYFPAIAAEASNWPTPHKYKNVIEELQERKEEEAERIISEFGLRKKEAQAQARKREKERVLAQLRAQLDTATGARLTFIEKEIAKLEKSLHKEENTHD